MDSEVIVENVVIEGVVIEGVVGEGIMEEGVEVVAPGLVLIDIFEVGDEIDVPSQIV